MTVPARDSRPLPFNEQEIDILQRTDDLMRSFSKLHKVTDGELADFAAGVRQLRGVMASRALDRTLAGKSRPAC